MDTFCELLSFLPLPSEQKFRFIPTPRVSPVDFDLVSGHLRTTYPLQFLVSLTADVFSTESYQPSLLQENRTKQFDQLLGLMHLMLSCRDERIWDPRFIQEEGYGVPFARVWDLVQDLAVRVTKELGFPIVVSVTYETLVNEWAGLSS